MLNLKKNSLIFLLIMLQGAIAVTCGFIALYIAGGDRVPPATFVGPANISNLTKAQAEEKLKASLGDWVKQQKVAIEIDGEGRQFEIPLSGIKAAVNAKAVVEQILKERSFRSFKQIINGYFLAKNTVYQPSVSVDRSELRKWINSIAALTYKDAVNAQLYLEDGEIMKVPGANGRRMNVDNAVNKLETELRNGYTGSVVFRFSNKYELEEMVPVTRTEDFAGIHDIVSTYSTKIKNAENLEHIKKAVSAINRVLVYSVDPVTGERAGVFSFNKYLNEEGLTTEQNDEGYNQVASTLHAAVIYAGIEPKGITRVHHKSPVDYIEPGLDVRVFGSSEDYKFRNSLDTNLVIFAEIRDNKVVVTLAGKKKLKF